MKRIMMAGEVKDNMPGCSFSLKKKLQQETNHCCQERIYQNDKRLQTSFSYFQIELEVGTEVF